MQESDVGGLRVLAITSVIEIFAKMSQKTKKKQKQTLDCGSVWTVNFSESSGFNELGWELKFERAKRNQRRRHKRLHVSAQEQKVISSIEAAAVEQEIDWKPSRMDS